jgi:hypothetical protein
LGDPSGPPTSVDAILAEMLQADKGEGIAPRFSPTSPQHQPAILSTSERNPLLALRAGTMI